MQPFPFSHHSSPNAGSHRVFYHLTLPVFSLRAHNGYGMSRDAPITYLQAGPTRPMQRKYRDEAHSHSKRDTSTNSPYAIPDDDILMHEEYPPCAPNSAFLDPEATRAALLERRPLKPSGPLSFLDPEGARAALLERSRPFKPVAPPPPALSESSAPSGPLVLGPVVPGPPVPGPLVPGLVVPAPPPRVRTTSGGSDSSGFDEVQLTTRQLQARPCHCSNKATCARFRPPPDIHPSDNPFPIPGFIGFGRSIIQRKAICEEWKKPAPRVNPERRLETDDAVNKNPSQNRRETSEPEDNKPGTIGSDQPPATRASSRDLGNPTASCSSFNNRASRRSDAAGFDSRDWQYRADSLDPQSRQITENIPTDRSDSHKRERQQHFESTDRNHLPTASHSEPQNRESVKQSHPSRMRRSEAITDEREERRNRRNEQSDLAREWSQTDESRQGFSSRIRRDAITSVEQCGETRTDDRPATSDYEQRDTVKRMRRGDQSGSVSEERHLPIGQSGSAHEASQTDEPRRGFTSTIRRKEAINDERDERNCRNGESGSTRGQPQTEYMRSSHQEKGPQKRRDRDYDEWNSVDEGRDYRGNDNEEWANRRNSHRSVYSEMRRADANGIASEGRRNSRNGQSDSARNQPDETRRSFPSRMRRDDADGDARKERRNHRNVPSDSARDGPLTYEDSRSRREATGNTRIDRSGDVNSQYYDDWHYGRNNNDEWTQQRKSRRSELPQEHLPSRTQDEKSFPCNLRKGYVSGNTSDERLIHRSGRSESPLERPLTDRSSNQNAAHQTRRDRDYDEWNSGDDDWLNEGNCNDEWTNRQRGFPSRMRSGEVNKDAREDTRNYRNEPSDSGRDRPLIDEARSSRQEETHHTRRDRDYDEWNSVDEGREYRGDDDYEWANRRTSRRSVDSELHQEYLPSRTQEKYPSSPEQRRHRRGIDDTSPSRSSSAKRRYREAHLRRVSVILSGCDDPYRRGPLPSRRRSALPENCISSEDIRPQSPLRRSALTEDATVKQSAAELNTRPSPPPISAFATNEYISVKRQDSDASIQSRSSSPNPQVYTGQQHPASPAPPRAPGTPNARRRDSDASLQHRSASPKREIVEASSFNARNQSFMDHQHRPSSPNPSYQVVGDSDTSPLPEAFTAADPEPATIPPIVGNSRRSRRQRKKDRNRAGHRLRVAEMLLSQPRQAREVRAWVPQDTWSIDEVLEANAAGANEWADDPATTAEDQHETREPRPPPSAQAGVEKRSGRHRRSPMPDGRQPTIHDEEADERVVASRQQDQQLGGRQPQPVSYERGMPDDLWQWYVAHQHKRRRRKRKTADLPTPPPPAPRDTFKEWFFREEQPKWATFATNSGFGNQGFPKEVIPASTPTAGRSAASPGDSGRESAGCASCGSRRCRKDGSCNSSPKSPSISASKTEIPAVKTRKENKTSLKLNEGSGVPEEELRQ